MRIRDARMWVDQVVFEKATWSRTLGFGEVGVGYARYMI